MNSKTSLRPSISTISRPEGLTAVERFQNDVLRPIIKLQNDSICAIFKQDVLSKNSKFGQLSKEQQQSWVVNAVSKDIVLKNQLIGLVIGLLETAELEVYLEEASTYNRRIAQMVRERIIDQVVNRVEG